MVELEGRSECLEGERSHKTEELNSRETQIREEKEELGRQKEELDNMFKLAKHKLSLSSAPIGNISKNDQFEIRVNMNNANPLIKFTLETIALLLNQPQDIESLKRLISDVDFLAKIKSLNIYNLEDSLDEELNLKIRSNEQFQPSNYKGLPSVAKLFCEYVLGVQLFR